MDKYQEGLKEYFLDRSCLPPHLKPEQTAGEALPLMLLCKYLVTVSKSCLEPELAPTPAPSPTPQALSISDHQSSAHFFQSPYSELCPGHLNI